MRHIVIALVALGCASAPPPPPPAPPAPPPEPSAPTGLPAGYVEMKPERVVALQDQGALLLVDAASNTVLPIFIGGTEAASIDSRMSGTPPIRPLTHDLLDHVMARLHATLVQVQVDELRGETFIGSIYVRANGVVFKLDSRPSDAIALAIGNRVPIYVAKAVLAAAGQPWDQVQQQLGPQPGTTSM
ncbi:MAG TPA: bifunctional nuclease family protein [Kofleriaceae bacterium]|nr:bifunctional nuclease family protein [Kofleriaceae bacterium]